MERCGTAGAAAVELAGDVGIAGDDAGGLPRASVQLCPRQLSRIARVNAEAERNAEPRGQRGADGRRCVSEVGVHAAHWHATEQTRRIAGLVFRCAVEAADPRRKHAPRPAEQDRLLPVSC